MSEKEPEKLNEGKKSRERVGESGGGLRIDAVGGLRAESGRIGRPTILDLCTAELDASE
jgi:hypothetical protein